MLITNGAVDSKRLDECSARELRMCKSVTFGSECGWTFAYGRDENGKVVIVVHAHSMDDLKFALMSSEEKRSFLRDKAKSGKESDLRRLMGDYDC